MGQSLLKTGESTKNLDNFITIRGHSKSKFVEKGGGGHWKANKTEQGDGGLSMCVRSLFKKNAEIFKMKFYSYSSAFPIDYNGSVKY